MTLMSPLCLGVLSVLTRVMVTVAGDTNRVMVTEAGCDGDQVQEMKVDFSSCTAGYKREYGEAVSGAGAGDLEEVTCSLLDNMVTVCGALWTRCHQVIILFPV